MNQKLARIFGKSPQLGAADRDLQQPLRLPRPVRFVRRRKESREMNAIAKWVGIILCIICGIGLMAGGPGTVAKVSGISRARIRAHCLAHHQLGAGALGGIMTRPAAKALNKPLLNVGLDRKLAGLALFFSVISEPTTADLRSPPSFCSSPLCAIGRRMTRKDPNIFLVLNQVRSKGALRSGEREWFRMFIERRAQW